MTPPLFDKQSLDAVHAYPWLANPASLARVDTDDQYKVPPHLEALQRELQRVSYSQTKRLVVNVPFGHGKSLMSSLYWPAWHLLLFPKTRFIMIGHGTEFASDWGGKVRDLLQKYGPEIGVYLRSDSRSKTDWEIDEFGGGMFCAGWEAGAIGHHAEIVLIDDLVKGFKQAMSAERLEDMQEFYKTTIYSRLREESRLVMVMTRWHKRDVCGYALDLARRTNVIDQWKVVKFKAIAEDNDPLGRSPGEPLWPAQYSLASLQGAKQEMGRWWSACWQQEPHDEEGAYFHPRRWPRYTDLGNQCFALEESGSARRIFAHSDLTILTTVDWAWSERATADYTAIGTFGLTPDGRLLVLDIQNRRLRLEQLAPELANVCHLYHPSLVAVEVGHPTLHNEYRRYPSIPEIRWIKTEQKTKLTRALPAIMMGENNRVFLPNAPHAWLEPFIDQLGDFTGVADEHDDMCDALAYACHVSQSLRYVPAPWQEEPQVLVSGKVDF